MIISDRHKFIFIHVPKCAGTSITLSLLNNLHTSDTILGCIEPYKQLSRENKAKGLLHKHSSFAETEIQLKGALKDYFVFAFVRNPFDLVLSQYYWWQTTTADWSDKALEKQKLFRSSTFKEFVFLKSGYLYRKMYPFIYGKDQVAEMKKLESGFQKGQLDYLQLKDKVHKYKNQSPLDYLGRYEDLSLNFVEITRKLGLEAELKEKNISKNLRNKRGYLEYFDKEMLAEVKRHFAIDFILFDYNIDPVISDN